MSQQSVSDEVCPIHEDGSHCEHWWDGQGCHACGAPPMSEEEKVAQGMVEGPPRRPVEFGCAFALNEDRRLGSASPVIAKTGERA